jgi:hypothetical protein
MIRSFIKPPSVFSLVVSPTPPKTITLVARLRRWRFVILESLYRGYALAQPTVRLKHGLTKPTAEMLLYVHADATPDAGGNRTRVENLARVFKDLRKKTDV